MRWRQVHEPATPMECGYCARLIVKVLSRMQAEDDEVISADSLRMFCNQAANNPKQFPEFFPELFPNHDSSKSSSNAHHQAKLSKTRKGRRNWRRPFG